MSEAVSIAYTKWDWLPKAAAEMEAYVSRLLEEFGIKPHDVTARAKSISSFQRKLEDKEYTDPERQMTDIVGVRVITYSHEDRERACELIRERFVVKDDEDRNPGEEKSDRLRGYDCQHIVVESESPSTEGEWLVAGGSLAKYFEEGGGLEVQVRTVAGHAWAEFEHARRYKGVQYEAITDHDKATIDQLFGAASDARRALDEIFVAIDRVLASPSAVIEQEPPAGSSISSVGSTALDTGSLAHLLLNRFQKDQEASERGLAFGLELARLCELETVQDLESALNAVDSEQVVALMDVSGPVTRVRRLDDELLARFGEEYIGRTQAAGSVRSRARQLEWRFDRLRGKVRYKAYVIQGVDWPDGLEGELFTAVGAVRELAVFLAKKVGIDAVVTVDGFSCADDLPEGMQAREFELSSGDRLWLRTNLGRVDAERMMGELLHQVPELDIKVFREERVVAESPVREMPRK